MVGCHRPMKVRRLFIVSAALAVLVAVISIWLLQPSSHHTTNDVALYFRGYTNTAGTNMAVFEVTNHTKIQFVCFVGARASVASRGGRPLLHAVLVAEASACIPWSWHQPAPLPVDRPGVDKAMNMVGFA